LQHLQKKTVDCPEETDAPESELVCADFDKKNSCDNTELISCIYNKWTDVPMCIDFPVDCSLYTDSKDECKKLGCEWDKHTGNCGELDAPCDLYHGDKSMCKKRGCIWNKFTEICSMEWAIVCSDFNGDKKSCKNSNGGCVWQKFTETCTDEEVIPECHAYNDSTECKQRGCAWNKIMSRCFYEDEEQTFESCSEWNNNKSPCKKLDCVWDKKTEICSDP